MIVTVALLRAAGLTEVQINRVTELADAEITEKRRAQNRKDQQNHRARKRSDADCQQCQADIPDRVSTLLTSLTSLPSIDRPLSVAARASDWPRDYREQFWAAYPKKAEKPYALKCLEKVMRSGVEFPVVMAGVARIDRSDPKFIKNPSTWLNRGCWTDGEGAGEPVVNHALLEEHRRQCLMEGSDDKAQAEIRRDTRLGEARAGDIAQLRSPLRVVRSEDQTVGGQLAFPKQR